MARLRFNFQSGLLGAALTDSSTTISFAVAPGFPTISGSDIVPITIDKKEIVHLTAYAAGANTGTILRGQEGTTAVAHNSGVEWRHAYTAEDAGSVGGGLEDTWHVIGTGGEPAFQNGWSNYGADWLPAQFIKDSGGWVHTRGLIKPGTTNTVVFTFPVGYRPGAPGPDATNQHFAMRNSGGSASSVVLANSGGLTIATSASWHDLVDLTPFFAGA